MTRSREEQVDLDSTSFYHCYVRCVRRAYLCGADEVSGQNFDHRKQWLVSRLRFLSYVFSIDICAYAVMSNHYHVVLHVDKERALGWSQQEVVERWLQLYKGNMLINRWLANPKAMDKAMLEKVSEIIEEWRTRLYDLGWFMRGINETIARMANEEDQVKGRFWEGRYKSQALLDEGALLTCMTYVDLNPVRAGITNDIVTSDFTSIQQRIYDYSKYKAVKTPAEKIVHKHIKAQKHIKEELQLNDQPEAKLMPFGGSSHTYIHVALPFTREDYFELVDTTGRIIREDKRGYIPDSIKPILSRMGIESNKWLDQIKSFGKTYANCAGSRDNILLFAQKFNRQWGKGAGRKQNFHGFA